ncbi:MAG: hypothetical protein HY827_05985 [Actinobacteria bacterium]|nr:hypothetical protein [Actinomycetota bacterium]
MTNIETSRSGSIFPVTVISDPGRNSFVSDVAINERGECVVVFSTQDKQVYAVRSTPDLTWHDPEPLSSGTLDHNNPRVGINDDGDISAVWCATPPGQFLSVAEAAHRPSAGPWSQSSIVSVSNVSPSFPQIVVPRSGPALVGWDCFDGDRGARFVQAATANADGSWNDAITLSEPGAVSAEFVIDDSISTWATWMRFPDRGVYESGIQTAFRPPGGAWQPERTLTDDTNAWNTRLAVDQVGGAGIAWNLGIDGSRRSVIEFAVCELGGEWSPAVRISPPGHDATLTSLALTSDERAVAAWNDIDEMGQSSVWVAAQSEKQLWGAGRQISTLGHSASRCHLELTQNGRGIATWHDHASGSGATVSLATCDSDGRWANPQQLSAKTQDPRVGVISFKSASNSNGDTVIAWTSNLESGRDGRNIVEACLIPGGNVLAP